jgi:hypothetical protein
MARTDTRLVVAIVSTAILSGTIAGLVATKLASPEPARPLPRPAPVAAAEGCASYKAALQDCRLQVTALELKLRDATRPVPPPATCDEVSCVLNNYDGTCCEQYKRPAAASLERQHITAGIAARIQACGASTGGTGQVNVHVKVAPDGHVTSVEPREDDALGRCVADIVRGATFAKTQSGGSFSYPFVF